MRIIARDGGNGYEVCRKRGRDTEMRLEGTEKERKNRAMCEKEKSQSKNWSKPLTALCLRCSAKSKQSLSPTRLTKRLFRHFHLIEQRKGVYR